MNQILIKYQKIINGLPLAARAILLATTLGVVFVIWYYGFWQYIDDAASIKTKTAIKTAQATIPLLKTKLQETEIDLKNKEESAVKNKDLSQSVSPQTVTKVLQDLLASKYNLVLLQLQNLPSKVVLLSQSNLKVVEHSMIIKFQGDYFSTMNYLQAIESLPWRISWDRLEYKVIEYPTAEVTLQIHILSNQGGWFDA
jgi:type II secretory pathway component PulM